jgi:hypothetical protein
MLRSLRKRETGSTKKVRAPLTPNNLHKIFSPYNFASYINSQYVNNNNGNKMPMLSKRAFNSRPGMWTITKIVGLNRYGNNYENSIKNKKVAYHALYSYYIDPKSVNAKHKQIMNSNRSTKNNKKRITRAKYALSKSKKQISNYKNYYNSYTDKLLNVIGI